MANSFDGLENVVAGLGTERDKAAYARYGHTSAMSQPELENMYRASWLCKRIVNSVADDMTRKWRDHLFDSDQQFAVESLESKLAVQEKTNEALRYARLYGGAALILGVNGEESSEPLNPSTVKKDGLRWILPVDRYRLVSGGVIEDDPESSNFGFPREYILSNSKSTRIHHTRVIRFEGQRVPYFVFTANGYWHDSEIMHTLASIKNADTASAGIGTMLYEANVDVISVNGLRELLTTECGEAQLVKRFQLAATMKSFNRALILDEGEKYEKKSNSFANLDKIWERFDTNVCGAADIPMVRLFGQSAAGMNATGDNDVRNYYDMISSRQEKDLRPALAYLDEVLIRSALGDMPKDYRFEFRSLWQMSDKEKSEIGKTNAERDKIYLEAGVLTEGVVARELREDGTYSSLTDEDVKLAEELSEALTTENEEV